MNVPRMNEHSSHSSFLRHAPSSPSPKEPVHMEKRARTLTQEHCPQSRIACVLIANMEAHPEQCTEDSIRKLARGLQIFSPKVEYDKRNPGVLFADPDGLEKLYGDLSTWGYSIEQYLRGWGMQAYVVIGFDRFSTFSFAKHVSQQVSLEHTFADTAACDLYVHSRTYLLHSPESERNHVDNIPVQHLAISDELKAKLVSISMRRTSEVRALTRTDLRNRFGKEAGDLWENLHFGSSRLLHPLEEIAPPQVKRMIEPADDAPERLLFAIKSALNELMQSVEGNHRKIKAVKICFALDRTQKGTRFHYERIASAYATDSVRALLHLIRLRLEGLRLPAKVAELSIEAEESDAPMEQLCLGEEGRTRAHYHQAEQAFSELQSILGEAYVAHYPELRDAHLPEARFRWKTMVQPPQPQPSQKTCVRGVRNKGRLPENTSLVNDSDVVDPPVFVRRIFETPLPLATQREQVLDPQQRPFACLHGPYRIRGGWWVRDVARDYYYAETQEGKLLWIYFDRVRSTWLQHGIVD